MANTLSLSRWIAKQERKTILNDFFSWRRDYSKRNQLYKYIVDLKKIENAEILYVEFGVFEGHSFKWWLNSCKNSHSRFYGFDTFEGLPEEWGTYTKGEMTAKIPVVDDERAAFIKGLFQDSLPGFLASGAIKKEVFKIIHFDADLFSSTLYTLTSMAPFLNKGDILMFDEFNVPNHEFLAFKTFTESFYIKTRLIGAVNNYYQVAFEIL
jgi:hypothetical protein